MKRSGKGSFGPWQLPIAGDYINLRPHNRLLIWGTLCALAAALLIGVNFLFLGEGALSAGPISSAHALAEEDCGACHSAGSAVSDRLCNDCHEQASEAGTYSFATHYVYRSNPPGEDRTRQMEMKCSACHGEHLGRAATLTAVADRRCVGCHPYGSFNDQHPPFDFSAESPLEEPGIKFSHTFHTIKVATEYQLEDAAKACLYCHVADSEGRHFQDLSFDLHCASCHLKPPIQVGPLPVVDRFAAGEAALLSLEGFRNLEDPPAWVAVADPGRFSRPSRGEIVKSIVDHRDRWILGNLELLGAQSTQGTPPRQELENLYRLALDDLRDYASGLSQIPEPDLLSRLARIQSQLSALDRQVARRAPAQRILGEEERKLVEDLTEPCRLCHVLDGPGLAVVQNDQRVLKRAEFDHGPHLAAEGCIGCHNRIPVARGITATRVETGTGLAEELAARGIPITEFARALELPGEEFTSLLEGGALPAPAATNIQRLLSTWSRETDVDRAAIQNVPGIEKCRECHQPRRAAADCVNCHLFHPHKGIQSGRSFTFR